MWTDYYNLYYTKRGKLQANISQQLGTAGSIFSTAASKRTGIPTKNTLIQLGYSGTVAGVTYNLTYNYNKSPA